PRPRITVRKRTTYAPRPAARARYQKTCVVLGAGETPRLAALAETGMSPSATTTISASPWLRSIQGLTHSTRWLDLGVIEHQQAVGVGLFFEQEKPLIRAQQERRLC